MRQAGGAEEREGGGVDCALHDVADTCPRGGMVHLEVTEGAVQRSRWNTAVVVLCGSRERREHAVHPATKLGGKRLPVIFMTANDSESTRRLGKEIGCIAYLKKPFLAKLLLDAIDGVT